MLTKYEVNELVFKWFRKLDIHDTVEGFLPLLAAEGLEMNLPEGTFKGIEGFTEWHHNIVNKFFDHTHTLCIVDIEIEEEKAKVKVVVNWQTKIWNPPDVNSTWLGFDAYQTWIVKKDSQTGKAVIEKYTVDNLEDMLGSGSL